MTENNLEHQLNDLSDEQLAANLDAVRQLRSESKKLRERAKLAESGLETASAQIAGLQREKLVDAATGALKDPADFWTEGTTVSSFVNDGKIDQDAVTEHLDQLLKDKPHFAAEPAEPPRPPTERPIASLRAGASPANMTKPEPPKWSDVIRGPSDE